MRLVLALLCFTFAPGVFAEEKPVLTETEINALLQSAERGDAAAQKQLADAYIKGNGVVRDARLGRQWMEKAAAQDHVPALNYLAYAHVSESRTFEQDLPLALRYAEQADATDTAEGAYAYGRLIISGFIKEIINDKHRARAAERLKYAYENGEKEAAGHLARGYVAGWFGEPANGEKARQWYEKWAETGAYYAHQQIAELYDDGGLLPRDYSKALHHYTLATNRLAETQSAGERNSRSFLSRMYFRMAELNELKTPPDLPAAVALYQKSTENDAKLREARILIDHGDPQYFPNILGYLAQQAREREDAPAMCLLMRVLREGRPGFPAQPETASEWWPAFERIILENYRVLDENPKWETYDAALCNQDAACREDFAATKDAVCDRAFPRRT